MYKSIFNSRKFARDVHNVRWGRGMRLQDVADMFGFSKATASRIESANVILPIDKFLMICGVFGLDPVTYVEVKEFSEAQR